MTFSFQTTYLFTMLTCVLTAAPISASGISAPSSCDNDPAFRFEAHVGETKKGCDWLKNKIRKELYCDKLDSSTNLFVKDRCPLACMVCPPPGASCEDSVGKVQVLLPNDQTKRKYCTWFQDSEKKNLYCDKANVRNACPKTCNACDGDNSAGSVSYHNSKTNLVGSAAVASIHEESQRDLSTSQFTVMGQVISGTNTEDATGHAVALSRNGLRIAIGAPGERNGRVRVFDWHGDDWVQIGNTLDGCSYCRDFGFALDMNNNGTRIIVGAPESAGGGLVRVYELDASSNTWTLIDNGIPMVGRTEAAAAGFTVTMNGAGDRIAYGAPRMNEYKGCAFAMEWVNGQWTHMGATFDASGYYATFGVSVAMDEEGKRLAIGSSYGGWFRGKVDIYDFNDAEGEWESIGSASGDDYYDSFGSDVDISDDGSRIVVGASKGDGDSTLHKKNSGEFTVLEYDGQNWNQIGQPVVGDAKQDKMGEAVAISGDGNRVAVSSPKNDDNGTNAGKIVVYYFDGNAWVPYANDIMGETANDRLGEGNGSIALDYSGQHLIAGAGRGNYYCGKVRVYESVQ